MTREPPKSAPLKLALVTVIAIVLVLVTITSANEAPYSLDSDTANRVALVKLALIIVVIACAYAVGHHVTNAAKAKHAQWCHAREREEAEQQARIAQYRAETDRLHHDLSALESQLRAIRARRKELLS